MRDQIHALYARILDAFGPPTDPPMSRAFRAREKGESKAAYLAAELAHAEAKERDDARWIAEVDARDERMRPALLAMVEAMEREMPAVLYTYRPAPCRAEVRAALRVPTIDGAGLWRVGWAPAGTGAWCETASILESLGLGADDGGRSRYRATRREGGGRTYSYLGCWADAYLAGPAEAAAVWAALRVPSLRAARHLGFTMPDLAAAWRLHVPRELVTISLQNVIAAGPGEAEDLAAAVALLTETDGPLP